MFGLKDSVGLINNKVLWPVVREQFPEELNVRYQIALGDRLRDPPELNIVPL